MSSAPNELRKDIMTPAEEEAWDFKEIFSLQNELKQEDLSEEARLEISQKIEAIRNKYGMVFQPRAEKYVPGSPGPSQLRGTHGTSYPLYKNYGKNPNIQSGK